MKQVYTFGNYLKDKFGCKVYKVGINISGFTCPNIDGTVAKGGCTFCENDSFSASTGQTQELKGFYLNLSSKTNPNLNKQLAQLEVQFNAISKRQRQEYGAKKFLVYFQSFTNTYAPFETLKALYDKALSFDNVIGVSIGTRSESITDETLDYLAEINLKKEIWIEFGIQSVYDETLQKINRDHRGDSQTLSDRAGWQCGVCSRAMRADHRVQRFARVGGGSDRPMASSNCGPAILPCM